MQYKVKSIILGRKKDKSANEEFPYLVEIKLFDINDAHKTTKVPFETLEFSDVMSVVIKNIEVKYLPRGSDIVLNNLKTVSITQEKSEDHEGMKIIIE